MRAGLIFDLSLIALNLCGWLIDGASYTPGFNAFVAGLLIAATTDELIRKGWRAA